MKAEEKEILYRLLSAAQDSLSGFTTKQSMPAFEDDTDKPAPISVPVLVVGEKPETDEEKNLLDKMLRSIGLNRESNCAVTTIGLVNSYLAPNKPLMILALGETVARNMLGSSDKIETFRGSLHESNGIPLIATFAPGELIANETLKRPVWEDLKLFKTELENRIGGF